MAEADALLPDRETVLRQLLARQRDPFVEELARWLNVGLTEAELRTFAVKSPDRWSQGIAILGRLAGYTDKLEIRTEIASLDAMSDGELEAELCRRLGLTAAELRALGQARPRQLTDGPRPPEAA
jgi:hypothetical protein